MLPLSLWVVTIFEPATFHVCLTAGGRGWCEGRVLCRCLCTGGGEISPPGSALSSCPSCGCLSLPLLERAPLLGRHRHQHRLVHIQVVEAAAAAASSSRPTRPKPGVVAIAVEAHGLPLERPAGRAQGARGDVLEARAELAGGPADDARVGAQAVGELRGELGGGVEGEGPVAGEVVVVVVIVRRWICLIS